MIASKNIAKLFIITSIALTQNVHALSISCKKCKKVLHTVGNIPKEVPKTIGTVLHDTAKTTGGVAGDVIHAGGKVAGAVLIDAPLKTVAALNDGLDKAGHETGKALNKAGQFVEKHPLETIVGVALIAGGGYLIVYQDYVLALSVEGVQVATITSGATSGVVAGSAMAGGGGAILGEAASKKTITPSISIGSQGETRPAAAPLSTQQAIAAAMPPVPENGHRDAARQVTVGDVKRDLVNSPNVQPDKAPTLPSGALDLQKIDFADQVSKWAEQVQPIDAFDPRKTPQFTMAERKLIEGIISLADIKAGSVTGIIHDKDDFDKLRETARGGVLDKVSDEVVVKIFGKLASTTFSAVREVADLEKVGDPMTVARAERTIKLLDQLNAYRKKRDEVQGNVSTLPTLNPNADKPQFKVPVAPTP